MIARRQLPVHSPIRGRHLLRAGVGALGRGDAEEQRLEASLSQAFDAASVLLTDSGTSALVAALQMACTRHRAVALPAFSCIDLTAAVLHAGVDVVLYDLDPATLTPDAGSLARAVGADVDAVVIAHLYGYPADMAAVHRLAACHDVTVIEDAAQSAGAMFGGTRVGSGAALTVLSFGRGKGMTGGSGGALLVNGPRNSGMVRTFAAHMAGGGRGVRSLLAAGAQWMLGRPSLYALPSLVPGLRLGEMVYHPAHAPRRMSRSAVALLNAALADGPDELRTRTSNADRLVAIASNVEDIEVVRPLPGASPGYLRLPLLDRGNRSPEHRLGVMRSYPRAMHEQAELRPRLRDASRRFPGATLLRRCLFTLPTHSLLGDDDIALLAHWLAPHGRQHARVSSREIATLSPT